MRSKNLLFIINAAPYSREFFEKLGYAMVKLGYTVTYALDSHFTDYLSKSPLPGAAYYYSDYLEGSDGTNSHNDLCWSTFFSDVDRHITFDVPLFGNLAYYRKALSLLKPFFRDIIVKQNIAYVFYEWNTNSFADAAYKVCQQSKDVEYVGISSSRFPGRVEFLRNGHPDGFDLSSRFNRLLELGLPKEVIAEVDQYLSTFVDSQPDYMKLNGLGEINLVNKYFSIEKIKRLAAMLLYRIRCGRDIENAYQSGNPLRWSRSYVWRSICRTMKSGIVKRYYQPVDQSEIFFLYPLHFHPEASTSVLARYYVDEIAVIKNIAFSLPLDSVLYVKEHPSAHCYNSLLFYQEINKLPNVKLIEPKYNTKQLIRRCKAVFTLTSTAGLEACILGKPVIVLGEPPYSWFRSCFKLLSYHEISKALSWVECFVAPSDCEIRAFLGTYFEHYPKGNFDFRVLSSNEKMLDKFVKLLQAYVLNSHQT